MTSPTRRPPLSDEAITVFAKARLAAETVVLDASRSGELTSDETHRLLSRLTDLIVNA